jgi:serine O-acetyltransferase
MGIRAEIKSIIERDPAAKGFWEVYFLYPGFKAVKRHRRAHWFYKHKMFFLARLISERARKKTGIEIHPGAQIGKNLFIDHGMGVVIGETAVVGDNCTIYQEVTLGGTGKERSKRHPTIGDNVVIGCGAKVLGPFRVGDNCKIAAGSVVLKEVPDNCTAVGIPAQIVRRDEGKAITVSEQLDNVNIPDPMSQRLKNIENRVSDMENKPPEK